MVSIRSKAKEVEGFGVGHFCGGVLISKSHVLTLGSCINNGKTVYKPDEINLVLGSRNRYDSVRTTIASPSQIKVHPDFNQTTLMNNVAIITVSKFHFNFAFDLIAMFHFSFKIRLNQV